MEAKDTTNPLEAGPAPVPILCGQQLTLRPPHPRDIEARQRHGRSAEFQRMVGGDDPQDGPMDRAAAERWFEQITAAPYCWIIERNGEGGAPGEAIGHARLHKIDPANRRARYAIGIFDPACWGRGYGTQATQLVLGYAFETLRLHRVDLRVLAFNQRAIRSYAKCGFVQEGIEREGAWINGRWESDVWMSILEDEYRAHRAAGQA